MAGLTTLDAMPQATYAGDTFLVCIAGNTYAAPDWSMEYHFRSGSGTTAADGTAQTGGSIDITSTDSGVTSHLFSVAATSTATWIPSIYTGVGVAIGPNSEHVTWWRGQMEVRSELSQTVEGTDTRSWAKRCLDNIEAVIEGRATSAVLNSTVAGQSLGRMTPEQLFVMRDRFRSEYQAELAKLDAEAGKSARNNIGISFVAP